MPKAKKAQSSLGKSLMNKKRKDDASKVRIANKSFLTLCRHIPPTLLNHKTNWSQSLIKAVLRTSYKWLSFPLEISRYISLYNLFIYTHQALKETKVKTEHHVIDLNSVNNLKPKIKIDDGMTLSIPRRPKWNASTTPEQLTVMENV